MKQGYIPNDPHRKFAKSLQVLEQAKRVIPAQTQTFSKGWTQYPLGVSPVFAARTDGGYVWDVDGNKFIDWPMALGPLLLGHNNRHVNDAVRRQLDLGIAFSLPHQAEVELAERLIAWFPYAEGVRFGKNGSDVTAAAVRAARAFTGRDIVLCCGYHGWQDWFIGTTTRNRGVPDAVRELTIPFGYNDLVGLERLLKVHAGKVACIIMEPIGIIAPQPGYLEGVKKLAEANGAILVFDECWCGFRLHKQGAFGKYGVAPHLSCFGKAIGNGVPISIILGRADIMAVFEDIFFSFTYGGDLLGIAAANAVMDVFEQEPVLEKIEKIGQALIDGVVDLAKKHKIDSHVGIGGYAGRNIMTFKDDEADGLLLKSIFQQEALCHGVLAAGWHAPCYAHSMDDVRTTLRAYDEAFAAIARGLSVGNLRGLLHGQQVQQVFRKP